MINRRFAPKTKELIYFRQGSKSIEKEKSPKMFSCESFSKQKFVKMDHKSMRHYQQQPKKENILNERKFPRPFQRENKDNMIDSQRSPILSGRKQKLQDLRSSIQGLQKIIQRSRQMLNESSVLNSSKNTLSSSKQKIKSDSLDIKFNYSTKKMNTAKLSQIKVKKILNQSLQASYGQQLFDDSTNQSYRQKLLLESMRKNQSIFNQKGQSSNFKSKDTQNTIQIKTNHQLNMTLEKLLNQSFQSTINGKTLSISIDSPSSTFTGQTPKWFKSNDFKKSEKFQIKNKNINIQNDSFSNHMNSIQVSQLSQYEKIINNQNQSPNKIFKKRIEKNITTESPFFHQKNINQKTFDQLQWNDVETKQNIFIEDKDKSQDQIKDDIIDDEQPSGVKKIQNFFTNSRHSYRGEMRLQNSYQRNINSHRQIQVKQTNENQKSKRLVLRTPKAYQNYQQNYSSRKNSKNKTWIPKNFNQFENKVLKGKVCQNIFKQEANKGKFSPRIIHSGKQNKKQIIISQNKNKTYVPQDKDKRKKFINDVWKYPFVQRYLKESDIFLIYEKLRRSKIPQNKWILFVIDEVHKKMKQSH